MSKKNSKKIGTTEKTKKSIFDSEYTKIETNEKTKMNDDSKTYLYWKQNNNDGMKKEVYDILSSIPQKCDERKKMYKFVEICILNKQRIEKLL